MLATRSRGHDSRCGKLWLEAHRHLPPCPPLNLKSYASNTPPLTLLRRHRILSPLGYLLFAFTTRPMFGPATAS